MMGSKNLFAAVCRTYLILKDKAARWNAHPEIKSLLAEIARIMTASLSLGNTRNERASSLLAQDFDRAALAEKGLKYERLDQLTMDTLLGVD
jgi:xylose isomerase